MREEDQLADILFEWRERRDRGEIVDPESVIREHPDLADRLRSWFLALAAVDEVLAESPALSEGVPEVVGGYRILRELGVGGMGSVYLAEREESSGGDRVALKILHPHLLANPGTLSRFRREAEAGQAVDHENVLRTLDVGMDLVDGQDFHYLVLEYAEGRTLRELLADLVTFPEAFLREVAAQVAAGVAAIHAAGLVHRDLKPENIVVTADRRVRIMDLRIARLMDSTVELTKEGQFAGSLLYASPEHLAGHEVGVEADLYSVGVTLYELATGENPFRRPSVPAIVHAQLHAEPPPARDRNPEVSPFLEELLRSLLRKEPSERLGSTVRLASILNEGENSTWWRERERALRDAESRLPRIPVRRETRLTGRAKDLSALEEAWRAARSGRGGAVFLTGEAGIGKTRLIDEFLRRVGSSGINVLYGSYSPFGGSGGLSEAVIHRFGELDLASALGRYLSSAADHARAFAAAVLSEDVPAGVDRLAPGTLATLFCRLARALAAEHPTIWVIEDLHNSSEQSLAIIRSLMHAATSEAFLLLLTARAGSPSEPLSQIATIEDAPRLELSRLSPREVVELLRESLKSEELADRLGARIAYQSDGVPFFICEMIRGLEEGQFITEQADGSFAETKTIRRIETPEAVRELVAARLMGLSRMERAILDVGAVMGFEFDPNIVASVREMKRLEVLESLAHLERRSGIVRGAAGVCRFDHHQIQEVLYNDLPPDLRAEYHTLIADEIRTQALTSEGASRSSDEGTSVLLASHFLSGSRPADALPHLGVALDRLASDLRQERALELAELALEKPGLLTGGVRAGILLRTATLLDRQGREKDGRRALEEAATLAEESEDPHLASQAGSRLASWLIRHGMADRAVGRARTALDAARASGNATQEVSALRVLAKACRMVGRSREAIDHAEGSAALARKLRDPVAEAGALIQQGCALEEVGLRGRAGKLLEGARRLARRIDPPEHHSEASLALGRVSLELGRAETAFRHLEEALAGFRRNGDRRGEADALAAIGRAHRFQGRYGKAMDYLRRALSIHGEVTSPREKGRQSATLGEVVLRLGRLDEAERLGQRAVRSARDAGDRVGEVTAIRLLGAVALSDRRLQDARGRFDQALELLAACEAPSALALVLLSRAESNARGGDAEAARVDLEEAGRLGREIDAPGIFVLAAARLAALTGRWGKEASILYEQERKRIGHPERLEIRLSLHRATGAADHLEAAERLLEDLARAAPEGDRDGLREWSRRHG